MQFDDPLSVMKMFNYLFSLTVLMMSVRSLRTPVKKRLGRPGVSLAALVCFASVVVNFTILDRYMDVLTVAEEWWVRIFLAMVAMQSLVAVRDYDNCIEVNDCSGCPVK